MNKLKQSLIVSFMAIILVFTSSCYADDDNNGYYYSIYSLTGIGAIAVGVGIIGAIALLINKSNAESISPAPVILSGSNYNLLSINGSTTSGKIIVRNNGTSTVKAFIITGDYAPIIVDPNSSCLTTPTPPGGQCEINISYTGTAGTNSRTHAQITAIGDETTTATATNSDTISINIIDVAPNTFFNPSSDDTRAMGVGEKVRSFAKVNKNGIDFLYIASDGGGVFKSSDAGATWIGVSNGLTNKNVRSLCLHSDGYLYAGTDGGGVFKTNDGGANWTPVNTGLTGSSLNIFCLLSSNGYLYIGTDGGGIFRTNDGGASWNPVNTGLSGSSLQVRSLCSGNGFLFAGTADGVFVGEGTTWAPINTGLTNTDVYDLQLEGNFLFAGTDTSIFRTDISNVPAVNWTQVLFLSLSPSPIQGLDLYSDGTYVYVGVIDDTSTNVKIYKSILPGNSGTWSQITDSALGNANIYSLFADNSFLYAGTLIGVYKSNNNGTSWISSGAVAIAAGTGSLGNGIPIVSGNGYLFAGVYTFGVFRSNDQGANWTLVNSGLTDKNINSLHVGLNLGTTYLYAGTIGKVFKTVDNGATWTSTGPLSTTTPILSLYSESIYLYAGTHEGVFRSINNGDNWVSKGPLPTPPHVNAIHSDSNYLYAGGFFSLPPPLFIARSNDHGDNWDDSIATGLSAFGFGLITSLYSKNAIIYVGGSAPGVYYSANQGVNWSPTAFTTEHISSLYADNNYLYAGTHPLGSSRVFKSSNPTVSWTAFNKGTGIVTANQKIAGLYSDGQYIYAGCSADGIVKALIQ